MPRPVALVLGSLLVATTAAAQNGDRKGETQDDLPADLVIPPAPALTPEQEHATFALPAGFEIQLVAAEPLVVDPVQLTFDELGRLWVVEMRGYMQDALGTGEHDPVGRIAILSDLDGDGVMDARKDFARDLVLPRGVVPMHGGALCMLPPELVFLRDDDGDGAFDVREVVAKGLRKGLDNPEHDINTPVVGLDGWVSFANWDRRVRRVFDEEGTPRWEVERTRGGGQWGLGLDELGRFYRNTNPSPLHVDVVPARYGARNRHQRSFQGNFAGVGATKEVFPARINPGVNRGYQESTLRDDFTLQYFTGACSPTPLTGGALGPEARGDVFVCEPCGNLVKRYDLGARAEDAGLVASSVHARHDFLTSTDERFRPVAMATGPDGALYVADMYRGIIQHRIFMTTFLRKQVDARGLATPLGQGRVWRVVKRGAPAERPAEAAGLMDAPLAELAAHLGSDNAWLRRQAHRLLVEFFDGEASAVRALREGVVAADAPLRAVHSLWALASIGFLDEASAAAGLAAVDPRVRAAAAEACEGLLDLEGNDLFAALAPLAEGDPDPRARLHALLAVGASSRDDVLAVLGNRMTADASSGYERAAVVSGLEYREAAFLLDLAARPAWARPAPGRADLVKELAACVGREGLAENIALVVDLALDPPGAWWSKALLDGLFSTRRKGPKGENLPIPLRAIPASYVPPPAEGEADPVQAAVDEGCTWPGKPGAVEIELPRELTPEEQRRFDHGATVFAAACATCHQSHGGGDEGKAPTLRGTQYAVGDEQRLARILLFGLEGPLEVEGVTWNMEMPRFEGSDEDLAAVLTYVRRSWGNGADPVTVETVRQERARSGGRTQPLRAGEL